MVAVFLLVGCSDDSGITDLSDPSPEHAVHTQKSYIQTCAPTPAGIVSWWRAEDSANDFVDANHGVAMNGVSFVPGVVGQAFSFDGVDDRISLEDTENLRFTGSFSIETWLYVRSWPTGGQWHGQIFFRGDDRISRDPYYLAIQPDAKIRFHIEAEGSYTNLEHPFTLDRITHVAAVLDGVTGKMSLFLDGDLVEEQVTSLRPFHDLDPGSNPGIGIGNHGGDPLTWNQPFDGLIDELAVYSSALSPDEIRAIAGAGSAGKCRTLTVSIDIKPGSIDNPIRPISGGLIPVAILTTDSFDAATVDPVSVRFGPGGAAPEHGHARIKDVNGDGQDDLLLRFRIRDTGIAPGDHEACLSGDTFPGHRIEGCDSIWTVGGRQL